MKRHAKAPSAGSTEGSGNSRGLFRRAFAIRGGSSGSDGSGARSAGLKGLLLALALAIPAVSAAPASAAPPIVTMGSVSNVSYTSAHVTGEVVTDVQETYFFFEYSTDGINWVQGNFTLVESPAVQADLSGLKGGTKYFVRLGAINFEEFQNVYSAEPNPDFTTLPVEKPTILSVADASELSFVSTRLSASIERPTNPDPGFDAECHFEYVTDFQFNATGFAGAEAVSCEPNPVVTPGESTVSAYLSNLPGGTTYHLRLTVSNAGGANSEIGSNFSTSTAPQTRSLVAFPQSESATVGARVNPRNGPVEYQFEWGTTSAYDRVAPANPESLAPKDSTFHAVSASLTGLQAGASYHFRIVATNTLTAEKSFGADTVFTTRSPSGPPPPCANQASRVGPSASLPDCRVYEFVSPGLNNAAIFPDPVGLASPDGSAFLFTSVDAPFDAESSTPINRVVARRGPGGWETRSLEPHLLTPVSLYATFFTQAVSDDFTQSVVESFVPLTAVGDDPPGKDWYLRKADGTVIRLTRESGAQEAGFYRAASRDFTHIFLQLASKQFASDPSEHSLYEWHNGDLRLVSIQPGPGQIPFPGEGTMAVAESGSGLQQISGDGELAVFSAEGALYLRIGGEETIALSASQKTGASSSDPPARASSIGITEDGSKVLFISPTELTDDATTEESKDPDRRSGDLYSYDVASGELTDLTVDTSPGDRAGADVIPIEVAAVNRAGSYAYFVARGQLAPGAIPGSSNLYVAHGGTVKFIASVAVVSSQAYVTPDGRNLAFSSAESPTGYDSINPNTGLPTPQIYKYTYGGTVECASCPPDGSPPQAGASQPPLFNYGTNLQKHTLSDDGRQLFFQSKDALVPGAISGTFHVYEYEDGEVHLLSSPDADARFLDATPSGEDVFIASYGQLMNEKVSVPAVYDARVGAESPSAAAVPCQGEACRGSGSAAGSGSSPGTSSFEAPGEVIAPKNMAAKAKQLKLRITVPGSGEITVSGKGLKTATKKVSKAGPVTITLTLKPSANKTRLKKGVFKTKAQVLFKPKAGSTSRSTGGRPVVSLRFEGPSKKGGK